MHRPARALSSLALALALVACRPPGAAGPGGTKPAVRPTSPVGAAGLKGANLVGLDGASLIGLDGATLIKVEATMLIGADGGSLIGADGGSLIGADGGTLIGADGGSLIGADGASLIGADGASIAGAVRAPAGIVAAGAGNAVSDMGGMYQLAAVAEKPLAGAHVYLRTASGKFVVDRKTGKLIHAVTNAKGEYAFKGWKPVRGLQVFVPSARVADEVQGLAGLRAKDQGDAAQVAIDAASTLMTSWIDERVLAAQADRAASLDRLPAALGAEAYGRVAAAVREGALPAGGKLARKAFADALERLRGEDAALGAKLEEVRRVMTLAGTDSTIAAGARAITLQQPVDVVQAPDGSIFVAEAFSGIVRRIGTDGRAEPVVGQGSRNEGQMGALYATDIAFGPDGKLYMNSKYAAEIFRCNPDGTGFESFAGGGVNPIGPGALAKGAKFEPARAIAFDAEGGLLIAEGDSDARKAESRLLRVAPDGTIAELGAPWAAYPAVRTDVWREINAIATAPDGALWVMEFQEGTLWLREPGKAWRPVVAGLATSHMADLLPQADGSVLLSMGRRFDTGDQVIDRITRTSGRSRFAGSGEMGANAADVAAASAKFADPAGLAAGKDGVVLVADQLAGMVRAIGADGIVRTIAGRTSSEVAAALSEPLNVPGGIAIDAQGRVVVTEFAGHSIRRLEGESTVRIAGGEPGRAPDGGRADRLYGPAGIAFQGDAMIVAEQGAQRIRRIAADGTITTLAGGGSALIEGPALLTPPAPREIEFHEPLAVAVSPAGLVHFTDRERIWRLDGDRLELVAGFRELAGDEDPGERHGKPAREAAMGRLAGLAFDKAGNLYASEVNTSQILKIDPAGLLTVHAGAGAAVTFSALLGGAVGTEGEVAKEEAVFVVPSGLAFDEAGNLYVTEMGTRGVQAIASTFFDGDASAIKLVDGRIRKITPAGRVTTIAGLGGPPGTALRNPIGVVVDREGHVIFVDNGTNQLKRL